MKLETPTPSQSPERQPINSPQNIERYGNSFNYEQAINGSEIAGSTAENASLVSEKILSTMLPTPVVDEQPVVASTAINDNPIIAGDDDLIEKEWVDKAKKIVAETRDNPHQRDKSVNLLQVDYIKKRYGRELGVVE